MERLHDALPREMRGGHAKDAAGLAPLSGVQILTPAEANEVFAHLPERMSAGLRDQGFRFHPWDHALGAGSVRLVTAFNTRESDVDAFVRTAQFLARGSTAGMQG